ncbi:MAG: ABC transporter ATP-binding protein, partial [Myxococcales bacterium]|nr:ABC transporter ATP-binding protein [Myxococcales bacterium]
GSGKTTLLRTLLALTPADEGRVALGDRPLDGVPIRERALALAWLPQRSDLPWSLPVEHLVMLGRTPHLSPLRGPGPADRRAVDEALEQVDAAALRHRDVRTLSGGELQRVLLARLLATGAPTLLLDEPTTALDVGQALAFLELTRRLAADGRCILMSLHELDLAWRYGDRALLLHGDDQGSHSGGTTAEVLDPPRLSEIFAVQARIVDGRLQFSPTNGSSRPTMPR